MTLQEWKAGLLTQRTWRRVDELNRRGYFKDKEKRILFGAPIPPEDVLPLRISTTILMSIVLVIFLIAAGFFSVFINIVLGAVIVLLMFLPTIMRAVLK